MIKLRVLLQSGVEICRHLWMTWLGAIAFYTCLPIPHTWPLEFSGIARWAPLVGVLIGGSLGLVDLGLALLHCPALMRSAIVVTGWLAITGGLHLDGAMDAADGLAVLDPQRRLEVMADSRAGAFGVMAAVVIVLLKTTALSSLTWNRGLALMLAAGWGRWGQLVAIARYPYLKATGKGAFHKAAIHSLREAIPSLLLLIAVSSIGLKLEWDQGWDQEWTIACANLLGCSTAWATGAWFNWKLGGHTGDTYGAIVEWTETLLLCGLTLLGT
ncbi:MAG: adenosylcobinamide-GDP ribazoletransferase [Leptolyngbyaceae cyanobacterium bins.349]|nr:adenosylcobinamide-GDP ribazoletransferase [Leptolyngbyaceae cyanobacterium bins.349]